MRSSHGAEQHMVLLQSARAATAACGSRVQSPALLNGHRQQLRGKGEFGTVPPEVLSAVMV